MTAREQHIEDALRLDGEFERILNLHRVEFLPATPPVVPPPDEPDRAALYAQYKKQTLAGVGYFRRARRTEAKRHAAALADEEHQRLWEEETAQRDEDQRTLTQEWQQLCLNEPDAVMHTLSEAFEDNEAPAAAVGVDGADVSLVVIVDPVEDVIPEQKPTTTPAGNLSLKKLTQTERADLYKQFVAGQVLVTVRETFAVAPSITGTRVVVLRNDGLDSYGRRRVASLLAVKLERRALDGVRWADVDAMDIISDVATEVTIKQKGRARAIEPLDVSAEPGIAALIDAVDFQELGGA